MTSGGRFYRDTYKPPAIQYIEKYFPNYYEYMQTITQEYITYVKNISPTYAEFVKNISENFVTYVENVTAKIAVYLEQTCPIVMNQKQTLTTVAADADFIGSDSVDGIPVGLIDADFSNLVRAYLLIIGRAVNTFGGQNNLDCTVASDNQWQWNIDGGTWHDLTNMAAAGTKSDGQMLDTDWECMVQGAIHPFTFMFSMTDLLSALDDRIGIRLQNARSRQNNLVVTVDVYLKMVWKL